MENWGLITYRYKIHLLFPNALLNRIFFSLNRETALLYDEKRSSVMNKERVLEVIAHELAHQWYR